MPPFFDEGEMLFDLGLRATHGGELASSEKENR
jgi:hypothetical protein